MKKNFPIFAAKYTNMNKAIKILIIIILGLVAVQLLAAVIMLVLAFILP